MRCFGNMLEALRLEKGLSQADLAKEIYVSSGTISNYEDGRLFEMQLIMKEEVEDLRLKWPMLDERSRYLLESKYILGKHDDDIAIELGMKAGSVRMALTRARKNAYRLLSSEAVKSGEA